MRVEADKASVELLGHRLSERLGVRSPETLKPFAVIPVAADRAGRHEKATQ